MQRGNASRLVGLRASADARRPPLSTSSLLICGSHHGPVRTPSTCAYAFCGGFLCAHGPHAQAYRFGFVRAVHGQSGGNGRKKGGGGSGSSNNRGVGAAATEKKPSLVLSQVDSTSSSSFVLPRDVARSDRQLLPTQRGPCCRTWPSCQHPKRCTYCRSHSIPYSEVGNTLVLCGVCRWSCRVCVVCREKRLVKPTFARSPGRHFVLCAGGQANARAHAGPAGQG